MKVTVEISDEQVVAFLEECIRLRMSSGRDLATPFDRANFIQGLEICFAMNRVIEYLGGAPVVLEDLK